MIKLGVCGSTGRMGSEACRAIAADPETELLVAIGSNGSVKEFVDAQVDAVVDFTDAAAVRENAAVWAGAGIHAVIGTSGLNDADLEALKAGFVHSHCIVAPNFALSAVLMTRFAALAAPFFDSAEVIEMHHERKADAPSGTALATVAAMAEASADWIADPTTSETLPGTRGGRSPAGIPVHSVRLKGLVAHQQVLLGGAGETLTIRQDTIDRSAFMPGMLLAAKRVVSLPPGVTVGLGEVLGI